MKVVGREIEIALKIIEASPVLLRPLQFYSIFATVGMWFVGIDLVGFRFRLSYAAGEIIVLIPTAKALWQTLVAT